MQRPRAPALLFALALACSPRSAPISAAKPGADPLPAPPSVASVAPPALIASADPAIGTAHPVVLEAAAPDGRWAVLCQAREDSDGDGRIQVMLGPRGELAGDRMQSFFVLGTGPGEPIDEFVASDGAGRFVAMIRAGRLLVFDTLESKHLDLSARGADTRADAANYLGHRAVTFDPGSQRLLYFRRDPDRMRAIVIDLESGHETVIDPGGGALWRGELLGTATVLYVISADTNGNGRLDFPVPEPAASSWRCRGPIPRFDAWQGRGDAIETRVAVSGATEALSVPGFVTLLGTDFVVREPSGRLSLQRRGASVQVLTTVAELAPASCGARILHGDESRRLLLIACTKSPGRAPVELVGERYRSELKVTVEPRASDAFPRSPQRLFALYPGAQGLLVDFETRQTTALEPGETVIMVHGTRLLVRRGNSLSIRDFTSGSVTHLPGQIDELADVLHQPPVSYVAPLIADLSKSRLVGALPAGIRPLALAMDGRALVPARSGDVSSLAVGPLSWTAAVALGQSSP